jgi:predicted GNAT family acetyltransferase
MNPGKYDLFEIEHDVENQKFYFRIDGAEDYLRYILINGKTMNMIKTYVPNNLRGKGIAAKIVEAGLKYAEEKKIKVIPTCSYVETYIEKHSQFKNLL